MRVKSESDSCSDCFLSLSNPNSLVCLILKNLTSTEKKNHSTLRLGHSSKKINLIQQPQINCEDQQCDNLYR